MAEVTVLSERRTSVDDIFDHLRKQIETLALKPGDRISEAEPERRPVGHGRREPVLQRDDLAFGGRAVVTA